MAVKRVVLEAGEEQARGGAVPGCDQVLDGAGEVAQGRVDGVQVGEETVLAAGCRVTQPAARIVLGAEMSSFLRTSASSWPAVVA